MDGVLRLIDAEHARLMALDITSTVLVAPHDPVRLRAEQFMADRRARAHLPSSKETAQALIAAVSCGGANSAPKEHHFDFPNVTAAN